jgi:hypothetical protein
MVMCLSNGWKGVGGFIMWFEGVQGDFRVIPTQLRSQRYNALAKTNENKINTPSWCWSTRTGDHPWIRHENFRTKILAPTLNNCDWQSGNSILALTCLESDQELNTTVIEDSFLFPTVIYTSRYDKWFKNYEFLNISQAAVSLCWQTGTTWENCIFDHWGINISENL